MLLTILSYIGILVASVAGVVSVLTDYRNKETNQITIWGKLAVSLILVASIVSVTSKYLSEREKQSKENLKLTEELEKQRELLTQIRALSYPIQKEYWLSLSFYIDMSASEYTQLVEIEKKVVADKSEGALDLRQAKRHSYLAFDYSFTRRVINLYDPRDKDIVITFVSEGNEKLDTPARNWEKSTKKLAYYKSRYPMKLRLQGVGSKVATLADFVGKTCQLRFESKHPFVFESFTIEDNIGRKLVATNLRDVSGWPLNPAAKSFEGICAFEPDKTN